MTVQTTELFIPGIVGDIEVAYKVPTDARNMVGIICHPNPMQGGTMHNKVVTTIARAFNTMGIIAVTFNYRGVGKSDGSYGDISGEVEDCLAVVTWVSQQWPQAKLLCAGFSFGAYIAASIAAKVTTEQLISVAPAVDRMPYADLQHVACPWLVIQGEDDEIVNPDAVYSWFDGLSANKKLVRLPATGHFFHGKLIDLQQVIQAELIKGC